MPKWGSIKWRYLKTRFVYLPNLGSRHPACLCDSSSKESSIRFQGEDCSLKRPRTANFFAETYTEDVPLEEQRGRALKFFQRRDVEALIQGDLARRAMVTEAIALA